MKKQKKCISTNQDEGLLEKYEGGVPEKMEEMVSISQKISVHQQE